MFVKRSLREKDKNEKVMTREEVIAYTEKIRLRVIEWEENKQKKAVE